LMHIIFLIEMFYVYCHWLCWLYLWFMFLSAHNSSHHNNFLGGSVLYHDIWGTFLKLVLLFRCIVFGYGEEDDITMMWICILWLMGWIHTRWDIYQKNTKPKIMTFTLMGNSLGWKCTHQQWQIHH
jgi:hypothetical protein